MYNAPQMTKYSQHFINNIILISINIKNQKPLKKGDLKLTILKKKTFSRNLSESIETFNCMYFRLL